jgi:glycosyltransferase involved in cell wall biosynthesis
MESCSVIIASYGDRETWNAMAMRALASVATQTRPPDEVHRIHGPSLHEARNYGARISETDWLCFLDCDDELEPGYLQAMMDRPPAKELRYPMVRYCSSALVNPAYLPNPIRLRARPLEKGNFMVIGTLVSRELFDKASGFRSLPAYEDWDLWIRCWMLGADPVLVEGAIYRAWRRGKEGRNIVSNPQELCSEILRYNKGWQRENVS